MGAIDQDQVTETLKALKRKYTQFSDRVWLLVCKHASVFGNASAVWQFHVSESTVRLFRRKYKSSLTNVHSCEVTKSPKSSVDRPLMIGKLLQKQVQEYFHVYRKKRQKPQQKPWLNKNDLEHLKELDLENSSWAKSLFKRMDFVKRAATTGRPKIPKGAKKGAEILFLHQVNDLADENNIPPSLIMNSDQMSLKYVPVTSHVDISGMTYTKSLPATFGIAFSNSFLPIQLNYGGNTAQSLPRTKSPEYFSYSANVKHFSNITENMN